MTDTGGASVHASAVKVGDRAVLIRGASGPANRASPSISSWRGAPGRSSEAALVGDDRVHLRASQGQLVVRPARELAGLIEIRGLGIRALAFVEEAIVGLVVDLSAGDAERLPPPRGLVTHLSGIKLPRIPVAIGFQRSHLVVAALTMTVSSVCRFRPIVGSELVTI